MPYIPLPQGLKGKYSLINVKCDRDSFYYSILATLHPPKTKKRCISSYRKYLHLLKTDGMEPPITYSQIPLFEVNNRK